MAELTSLNTETEFIGDESFKFKIGTSYLLIIIFGYYAIAHYFLQHVINYNSILYGSLSEQISKERIDELISQQSKYEWIGYLLISMLFLIRTVLTSVALYTGCFVVNYKIKFSRLFNCVLMAESAFILQSIVKSLWLYINKPNLTLQYIKSFTPMSLVNFFDYHQLSPWFTYPLQTINLFEILYWFLLAFFISKEINKKYWKTFDFVIASYGGSLLIWVALISFLVLNIS